MSRIGEKITKARTEKGLTRKQFSKQCGVSEAYLAEVESRKKVINDLMLKKFSQVLGLNLDEPLYDAGQDEEEEREVPGKRAEAAPKAVVPEWQSAFSSIIKDIPEYDLGMSQIFGYRHLPVVDRKIEGFSQDKVIYIRMADNSLSSFRLGKGDEVLVNLNTEPPANGLCFMEHGGGRVVRLFKKLDARRALLMWGDGGVRTETVDIADVKILGHLIRAEVDLRGIKG
jgi:transcriptional regulator with XRE-family HTH domain